MLTFTYNCTHTCMHTCVGTHTHAHTCYLEHRHPHTVGCPILSASLHSTLSCSLLWSRSWKFASCIVQIPLPFHFLLVFANGRRCQVVGRKQEHNRLFLEVPLEAAVAATLAKFGLFWSLLRWCGFNNCDSHRPSASWEETVGSWLQQCLPGSQFPWHPQSVGSCPTRGW